MIFFYPIFKVNHSSNWISLSPDKSHLLHNTSREKNIRAIFGTIKVVTFYGAPLLCCNPSLFTLFHDVPILCKSSFTPLPTQHSLIFIWPLIVSQKAQSLAILSIKYILAISQYFFQYSPGKFFQTPLFVELNV